MVRLIGNIKLCKFSVDGEPTSAIATVFYFKNCNVNCVKC